MEEGKRKPIHYFFGTGLGAGYIPVAPGTFGTLSGLVVALFFGYFGVWGMFLFILVSIAGNYYFYDACEKEFGVDPGAFVLDEWAGIGISLIPVYLFEMDLYIGAGLAFGLFRLFDISKVLGISRLENLPHAHGVLFDDILAGIYSAICLILFIFVVLQK